jgi:DNA replication ATP-dependent helicase Dna2
MNVSFTRARSKLVIFGSRKTLQREPLLAHFFDLMESQGWILDLAAGADVAHARVFEGCSPTLAKRSLGSSFGVPTPGSLIIPREVGTTTLGKENREVQVQERPVKRMKMKTPQAVVDPVGAKVGTGVLKRRPILQDLIGNGS